MIISDKEAVSRLDSPLNLINRLRATARKPSEAMALFTGPVNGQGHRGIHNPFAAREPITLPVEIPPVQETTLDTILKDSDAQIKLGLAHDRSLSLLTKAVDMLELKLDDISPSKLPAVVGAASKVVESIRRERTEASKNQRDREVHYHFYTPDQKKLENYEVIEVQ